MRCIIICPESYNMRSAPKSLNCIGASFPPSAPQPSLRSAPRPRLHPVHAGLVIASRNGSICTTSTLPPPSLSPLPPTGALPRPAPAPRPGPLKRPETSKRRQQHQRACPLPRILWRRKIYSRPSPLSSTTVSPVWPSGHTTPGELSSRVMVTEKVPLSCDIYLLRCKECPVSVHSHHLAPFRVWISVQRRLSIPVISQ